MHLYSELTHVIPTKSFLSFVIKRKELGFFSFLFLHSFLLFIGGGVLIVLVSENEMEFFGFRFSVFGFPL